MLGRETFIARVAEDAMAPRVQGTTTPRSTPAAHGRIVAARADGPGSAALVRRMAVESGRSVLRAANPGRPDIEATRANETTIRAVVVFVGRAM